MSAETSALQSVRAGTVVALWRYPVKSMMGAELNAPHAARRGLVGACAYALVDEATGKIPSAKTPGLGARLFACRAAFVEPPEPGPPPPPVRITLPEGRTVRSDEP